MPKVIAQKKAEEKKKNSSASSQSAYQQSVQIFNQQKQQDIAEAERLRNSINAQQSKTNQLDTLSGAQNYFDTVEAYRQRLLQLRGYGYNTSQAVQSIGTGAAQMRNALRGMSQADYLQQIALPQKYQGAGRNGVQAALERLSQQIQNGNRRTMTAAGVADVAKQALRSNGIAGTGASGTAQGEYNWLKQHQYEFWTEPELRSELGKKRAILEKYNSVYGDAASAVLRNYGGTLPELKNEIAALEGALRPKVYDAALSKLPENLRRDVVENAGRWQEQSRARVTNYQYDDGTGTADSETAQKNLDRLRSDLRRQRLTEDQIESLLRYGAEQYNANRMAQAVQTTQNDARNHWALTSAASVPMNLAGGVTGFADLLLQRVRAEDDAYTGGRTPLDFNSGAQALGNLSSTIRSTVGEMAEQRYGKAAGFLYQTGMSIADSTAAALTGQVIGVPNLAETLLSGSAAQQAAQDAHLRGASDRQALWSGVTAGAAEAFFEHASLENLRSIQRVALEGRLLGGAAFWKSVGVQAATEASEEAFTTIANTITDAIIMGDMSQINQQIQTNLLNGMSERDAIKGAWVDWIGQVALDAAGGALSGGVMGSGAGAIGLVQNRMANRSAQKAAEAKTSVREFSQKFGKQAKAVETVYQSGTADAKAFQTSFEAAYELGKSGAAMETAMTTKATQALNEEQRENAWLIGREAGVQEGTIKEEDSGASVMAAPTNAEGGTAQNGEGEAVRVRHGGERDAGSNSVGAVQPVERSTGSAQTGREIGIGGDAKDGAAAEVRYGERVSAKDLGIEGGAVIRNMRVVQEDSYTPEMRELQKQAEASGRKLVLVSGLIHAADKPGGNITKARGMVEEGGQGRVFVQVDNVSFTAKQIFGHENGHVRIRNGEIDLAATKKAVREAMTPEAFDRALQDYADAYYGVTMTPDEVWEEIVCDAQGEMNIFDRTAMTAQRERLGKVIREVRKASQDTAREGETRAPPEETQGIVDEFVKKYKKEHKGQKFSRETDAEYIRAVEAGDMETAQRMVDEAARKAGYNSPKLYHGTNAFGFTVIDPKKLNDRTSFFATDSLKTAGSYSGTTEAREIADVGNTSTNGIYQIYGNTDGFLVLDAGGEESGHISLGEHARDYNDRMSTRSWNTHATAKQIAKYAKSTGYPGVIIRNVIDDATPESRRANSPSDVYVFLKAKQQVKSADAVVRDGDGKPIPLSERFNPEKTDIRWSREDSLADLRRENRALEKETEQLRQQVAKWKRETKRTTRLTLREQDVRREAKAVLEQYSSEADASETARKMQALGEYIMNGEDGEAPSWETVREMARDIAEDVVGGERVMLNGDEFENFQLLTGILKKPLHITKETASDVLEALGFEKLSEFNAAHKGEVRITTKDAQPGDRTVQDAYFEMVEAMPGWFPADVPETEYLPRMLEVLDGLRPIYGMSDETSMAYDEAVTWAANDIIDRMLDESIRQSPPTFADRAQAKLERTVAQERERADRRVEKARETGERRLERQRDRFEERIARVREQGEKKLERTKRDYAERSQRAMDRLRERHDQQIRKLKEKQRAKERRARDRRDASAAWKQIQKLGTQFRQMADKPQQAPTKHAPRELANALAELAEQFRTENRRRVTVTLNDQIGRLENAYTEISDPKSEHFIYYSAGVDYMIQQMKQELFDVATTDMTAAQLDRVYQTLKAAHHTIANANKFVHGQWLIDKIEAGRRWSNEIINAAPLLKKGLGGRLLNLQLRPDSFFARLSGFAKNSVGEQIQRMFVEGEERMLRIQQTAYEHFREFTESKEFDRLSKHGKKDLVDVGLKDADGRTILLTRDMMLGLYMHLRSTDNLIGAAYGGFDVPELAMYYRGDTATGYEDGARTASIDESIIGLNDEARQIRKRIAEAKNNGEPESMEDLDRLDEIEAEIHAREGEMIGTLLDVRSTIAGMLTEYEKRLIEATDAWMIQSADYINEETRRMYGIEKANVEHYWPIHRNADFVNTDLVNAVNEVNLENWGSLKERVKSHAPIKLTGLGFEIENHTQKMSQFCGFAAVQRDFQQIYSTRLPGMHSTLAEQINRKFGGDMKKAGTSARAYIEKYVNDISGAPGGDKRTAFSAIRQNLARATLSINFRVAMSQVASIPTAAAEIGWGSMAKGWARSSVKGLSAKQQAKLAAADPWFWQRARGEGGMREFAEMRESNSALDRGYNKLAGTKLGKAILNWCQRFDMYATYTQWAMAEEWVKKHTEYRAGSEEFDAAVAAKYRDIIRRTQPNYTVTERSDLLRDTREAMKWATMYKTQSNQNLNILYEATARLRQYTRDLKAGKNGVTEADVKQARVDAANAYTGVLIGGTVAFALFRAAANAVIHAMNAYRDDDDELTAESFLKGLGKESMSAVAGMFLLGSEIFDFVYATISGDKYWGLTDSAFGALDDILTQANKVIGKIGTDDPPVYDDWAKLTNALMAPLGIPGKNAAQIVQGVWNHIQDIQNGEFLSFNAGVNRTAKQETSRILHHYLRGDGDKVKKAYADLVELKGGDEDKAQEAMRDAIRDAYLENQITDKQVLDMLKRYGGKSGDDGNELLLKWQCKRTTGIAVGDIKDAYLDGEISKQQAINMKVKYAGKTQEEAEQEIDKLDFAEKYGFDYSEKNVQQAVADGDLTPDEAMELWHKYGKQKDSHYEGLLKQVEYMKKYPGVDPELIGTQSSKDYEDYGKAAEIPAEDFFRYWQDIHDIQGDDKRAQGIAYIDSLPISNNKKIAMFLSFWAQSSLKYCPQSWFN